MEKKRNYWVSCLLAVLILSFGAVSSAFGATAGVTVGDATVTAGQEGFIVDVFVTDHTNIRGGELYIDYDSTVLTFVSGAVVKGDWLIKQVKSDTAGTVTIILAGTPGALPAGTETKLAEVTFNISDTVDQDSYTLTYNSEKSKLGDDASAPVTITGTNGTITIAKEPKITATASPDGFGTISSPGEVKYQAGESPTYTVTPAQGYRVKTFTVSSDATAKLSNGTAGGTYTFGTLKEGDNFTIAVVFELIPTYKVTASAGENGTISDKGEKTYNEGSTPTYTVTPNKHYEVATFEVLGEDTAALKDNGDGTFSYAYAALAADSTIAVTFKLKQYTVTATAGANGTISNAGEKLYGALSTPEYTITPDAANNYVIDKVTVGGADVTGTEGYKLNEDGSATYTFPALEANATIDVTFKLGVFKVTMVAKDGGSIEAVVGDNTVGVEGSVVTVVAGMPQQFKIKMDEGYEFFNVKVTDEDGTVAFKETKLVDGKFYTLTVDKNYTVTVKFQMMHMVTTTAAPAQGGTIDPAGETYVKDGETLDITVTLNDGWDATLFTFAAGEMPVEVAKYTDTGEYPYPLAVTADYFVEVMFEKDGSFHSSDCDMDGEISLMELMDFIELFKDSAIAGYNYDGTTMSSYTDGCVVGYAAGDAGDECLKPHSADCDGDCFISLSEFLRTVELWKEGYKKDAASTDCNGFVPAE
jgi:hypothetical protein